MWYRVDKAKDTRHPTRDARLANAKGRAICRIKAKRDDVDCLAEDTNVDVAVSLLASSLSSTSTQDDASCCGKDKSKRTSDPGKKYRHDASYKGLATGAHPALDKRAAVANVARMLC